jgi:hypothetical protein
MDTLGAPEWKKIKQMDTLQPFHSFHRSRTSIEPFKAPSHQPAHHHYWRRRGVQSRRAMQSRTRHAQRASPMQVVQRPGYLQRQLLAPAVEQKERAAVAGSLLSLAQRVSMPAKGAVRWRGRGPAARAQTLHCIPSRYITYTTRLRLPGANRTGYSWYSSGQAFRQQEGPSQPQAHSAAARPHLAYHPNTRWPGAGPSKFSLEWRLPPSMNSCGGEGVPGKLSGKVWGPH